MGGGTISEAKKVVPVQKQPVVARETTPRETAPRPTAMSKEREEQLHRLLYNKDPPPAAKKSSPPPPLDALKEEDNPLLYVDVNLGPNNAQRIVVYEGDTAAQLAYDFCERFGLEGVMEGKLTDLL